MENEEHAEYLQATITSRPIISNSVVPTIVDFTEALFEKAIGKPVYRGDEADDEHRTVDTKKISQLLMGGPCGTTHSDFGSEMVRLR